MTIETLNKLDKSALESALEKCCGAKKWISQMAAKAPYKDVDQLLEMAGEVWYKECSEEDWREAFTHHPRIGDVGDMAEKYAKTEKWASQEQSGVDVADDKILETLSVGNYLYFEKFEYIFIICATGKSAKEMLESLHARLKNEPAEEIKLAMEEQNKITKLRLKKLLGEGDKKVSQITTHILDTSIGKPGKGVNIQLQQPSENGWDTIAQGVTNDDGRIADLLAPDRVLAPGNYQMVFDTGGYFRQMKVTGFYPEVVIQFTVFDDSHYHVPLLINPYGYSTYRGS